MVRKVILIVNADNSIGRLLASQLKTDYTVFCVVTSPSANMLNQQVINMDIESVNHLIQEYEPDHIINFTDLKIKSITMKPIDAPISNETVVQQVISMLPKNGTVTYNKEQEKYFKCAYTSYEGYPVIKMPIRDIFQTCPAVYESEFYNTLSKSIAEEGLKNPIIIVKTTFKEAWKWKKKAPNSVNTPPGPDSADTIYMIWGGSNRYDVLLKMGATHVDCVQVNSFQDGYALQNKQRVSFKDLHKKSIRTTKKKVT